MQIFHLGERCIFISSMQEKHQHLLHSPYLPPTRNNSKQRMTTLLSLLKRCRSRLFLSCTASSLKSPDVPWPTFKRIKDVSPALDYSVVSRPVLGSGAHGFKSTQGTGVINSSFSGQVFKPCASSRTMLPL